MLFILLAQLTGPVLGPHHWRIANFVDETLIFLVGDTRTWRCFQSAGRIGGSALVDSHRSLVGSWGCPQRTLRIRITGNFPMEVVIFHLYNSKGLGPQNSKRLLRGQYILWANQLNPGRLTWNLKMKVWKIIFLSIHG